MATALDKWPWPLTPTTHPCWSHSEGVGSTQPYKQVPCALCRRHTAHELKHLQIIQTSCCWNKSVYLPSPRALKSSARSVLVDQMDLLGRLALSTWLLWLRYWTASVSKQVLFSNNKEMSNQVRMTFYHLSLNFLVVAHAQHQKS